MKKILKSSNYFYILLSLYAVLCVVSCSKDPDVTDDTPSTSTKPSNAKILTYFGFTSKDNPSMNGNSSMYVMNGTHYVTVPLGVPLTSLKATYTVSPGATVSVKNQPLVSGTTALDYSGVVEVKVTAEDKTSTVYFILVKNGIPELDAKIFDFMKKYDIPGISVSIGHREKLVYSEGFGYANKATREPLRRNYMLRLASCSKPMTSICVMRLVTEGKIKLTYRPFASDGILSAKYPSTGFEDITIQSLLEHTSGIAQQFDPMFDSPTKPMTQEQTIRYVLDHFNISAAVGTKHSYSNFGFCVLGRIIEEASGKTYEAYLKETIADAIGRTTPRIGSTGEANRFQNESVYYSQSGTNGYGNNMQRLDSCGGLIASTGDLIRLAFSLDGMSGYPDIMTSETHGIMTKASAARSTYAKGWRVNHSFFPSAAYHTGNLAGTATMWVTNYNNATHCAILCNSRSYISGFDDALYVLMRDVLKYTDWSKYQDVYNK